MTKITIKNEEGHSSQKALSSTPLPDYSLVMDRSRQNSATTSAWEEAVAAGIDMTIVEENLRRSVLERIRVHDRALAAAVQLMMSEPATSASKGAHDKTQSTAET